MGCAAPTAPRSFSVSVNDILVQEYLSQAESLISVSRYIEADMLLLKAREIAPDLPSLKVSQVRAFTGMNRFDDALSLLSELPDEKPIRLVKARILRVRGDLEGAINIYKEEGELRNASDLLYLLGREEEAFCLSHESLVQSGYDTLETFRHARLGFAVGVYDKDDFKKGKEAKFYYARGISLLSTNKIEDALLAFRTAKQIGGGAPEMYSDIEILESYIKQQVFPSENNIDTLKELISKRRSSLNFIPGTILVEIMGLLKN